MKKGLGRSFFSLEEPNGFDTEVLGNDKKAEEKASTSPQKISKFIEQNENNIRTTLSNCFDLIIREIALFNINGGKAFIAYLGEFSDPNVIENVVVSKLGLEQDINGELNNLGDVVKRVIGIKNENILEDFNKCISAILEGNVVIFIDMINKAYVAELRNPVKRAIEEPSTEIALRGPREGFTEGLTPNVNLIRKIIKNPNLKIEKMIVGKETNSNLAICYLDSCVDKNILQEVKRRIEKINLNVVIGSAYVLEDIEDDNICVLPTVFRTERPDVAASKILEGKIVIIVDGSPVVLSVPALFVEFMQAADDYHTIYLSATINRVLRYIGLFIGTTLPSMYVALMDFHQELIPTPLAISVIRARSGIPLPAPWECFFMIIAYDIIKEAGLRIPSSLGQTVSIVGALILGEAAVRAGIVGAPMIIVVAFAGTAAFTIPSPELSLYNAGTKYILLLLSSIFGILGLLNGLFFLALYMTSRRSFGVPYMYPIAPLNLLRNKDVVLRPPLWMLDKKLKLFKKNK